MIVRSLLFRKKWEDLSGKLGSSFNLAEATKRDAVLRYAHDFLSVLHFICASCFAGSGQASRSLVRHADEGQEWAEPAVEASLG